MEMSHIMKNHIVITFDTEWAPDEALPDYSIFYRDILLQEYLRGLVLKNHKLWSISELCEILGF